MLGVWAGVHSGLSGRGWGREIQCAGAGGVGAAEGLDRVFEINQPIAGALRVKEEKALGGRCPRRHGPLARLRLGRLGRATVLPHAGPVYFKNTARAFQIEL